MPLIEDVGAFIAEVLSHVRRPPHRTVFLIPVYNSGTEAGSEMYVDRVRGVALYSTGADLGLVDENIAITPILIHASDVCRRHHPMAVAVVIVDDPREYRAVPRQVHYDLVLLLYSQLAESGVELLNAWTVTTLAPEGRWTSLLDDDTGVLPAAPFFNSPVADLRPAAEPIPAVLEPDPDLATEVNRALKAINHLRNTAQRAGDYEPPSAAALLELVASQIRAASSGAALTAVDIASVEIAMRNDTVQRCLAALSSSPHGRNTQPLWTLLVRAVPAPRRARPALQLALSAYAEGDLDLTVAALRIALTDDPSEPSGQNLADAIAISVPPKTIHQQLSVGFTLARELGVALHPSPIDPPARPSA